MLLKISTKQNDNLRFIKNVCNPEQLDVFDSPEICKCSTV